MSLVDMAEQKVCESSAFAPRLRGAFFFVHHQQPKCDPQSRT